MNGDTNDVQALQNQIAGLQKQLEQAQPAKPKHHWVRTFWSTVLIVVACLLAPLSVVSVWARGEVTDTTRYVATVAPLAQNPAIQTAIADRITDEIFKYVDVNAVTSEAVAVLAGNRDLTEAQTAALQALTGPLNQGIESYTENAVDAVVQSEQFEAAWVQANTLVHQQLNAALTGQGGNALSLQDDQVVLDLGTLLAQVKELLLSRGFNVAERIPTSDATIVLFEAPNAEAVKAGYNLLNALGIWLPLIAVALAITGVFVCHSRRKALAWLGFGLMLAMAVGVGLLAVGRMIYFEQLPETVNTDAATAFFDQLTLFLRQGLQAGAAAGLVLFLGGLLMGKGRLAEGIRSIPVHAAAAIQGWLDSVGLHMSRVRGWVGAQATGLRIAASMAALVFIMLQRYRTAELVLWTTAVLLVVLFVIQILASGEKDEVSREEGGSAPAA